MTAGIVNSLPNIIQFYGVTNLKGGGTLRNYLRNNTITFEWKNQLRLAKVLLCGYIITRKSYMEILYNKTR
ncbi:unnamed protein product [Rhizophagus irregularis]|nr:unnamed protein product [Rhizophagus irregularis]CAB5389625.1 unnamed protein product [Rhizophagus irregularis]